MLPLLLLIVGFQRNVKPVLTHIAKQPAPWILWSTVGFGLFYAPLTFATVYGPGWLVAATFQLTIIAGSLLVPLLDKKGMIPLRGILISLLILSCVFIMHVEHASSTPFFSVILIMIPLIISAVAYPDRKRTLLNSSLVPTSYND